MNVELKALLSILFAGLKLEQDVVAKENVILMLPDMFALLTAIAPAVANWGDLLNEIKDLSQTSNTLDLTSFIQSQFNAIISNQKAQAIVAAVVKLIQDLSHDVLDLQKVINE